MALAYFITFSTYGTWLHGSEKGSVDDFNNEYGKSFVAPDPQREQGERELMTQPAYVLSAEKRTVVRDSIVDICVEKGWHLLALHVRTNHIHLVIHAERDPDRLMSDLKARASRDLTRAGYDHPNRRRWARHGSTRHLFQLDQVQEKITYTLDEQGPRMAVYECKEPRTQ